MILSQQSTVVVVPSSLKLELFQQFWLVKNKILKEDSTGFFTPVAIQATDDEVDLLILQDRIQISSKDADLAKGMKIAAGKITQLQAAADGAVSSLKSAGLNAQIAIGGIESPGVALSETYLNSTLLESGCEVLSAGLYLTQDIGFGAVTTRVSAGVNAETGEQAVVLDVNCHRDIVNDGELAELIASIDDLMDFCGRRVSGIQADLSKGA